MNRRVVGPHVYDALVHHALVVGRRCPVVVDAPFLEYIERAVDSATSLSDYVRAQAGTAVPKVTSIRVALDPGTIRRRMISRAADRDRPKLEAWSAYQSTVLDSRVGHEAKSAVDLYLTNSD